MTRTGDVDGTADSELDDLLTTSEKPQRTPRRPPGGVLVTSALLICATIPFLGWAGLSFAGIDSNRYTSALVALTPWSVPAGVVILVIALVLRRWVTSLVVGIVLALLVVSLAPRVIPNPASPDNAGAGGAGPDGPKGTNPANAALSQGIPLRIASSNLYFGQADPGGVVDLVRRNRIDVLTMQELTPQAMAALDRAGLSRMLPHRIVQPASGGAGTGIVSRYPLHKTSLMPKTTLAQPSARVDLPGARGVDVVAVHPIIPVGSKTEAWKRELGALPEAVGGPDGVPRVAAGDFNATLDHTPVRALLGRGYVDAAERTGGGLRPTWPNYAHTPPFVTLDHVLAGGATKVRDYGTFDVAGTEHRAIFAELTVPR